MKCPCDDDCFLILSQARQNAGISRRNELSLEHARPLLAEKRAAFHQAANTKAFASKNMSQRHQRVTGLAGLGAVQTARLTWMAQSS
jgi:hypothetical protein